MTLFSCEHLIAGYGKKPVLDDLSFCVEREKLLCVLGENGSGKTTLIKAICGILPHQGRCLLSGTALERLPAKRLAQLCSYIPQRSGIFIDISALDVVLMGMNPRLSLLESPTDAMRAQAHAALEAAGIAHLAHSNYQQLSEGQKQLCLLARTLISGADLLLMDEPESALDFSHRAKMLALLRRHVRAQGRCAVIALHDPALALNFCDELLLLKDGKRLDVLRPASDNPEAMEQALSRLYGPVTLRRCTSKSGLEQLVMLRDEED